MNEQSQVFRCAPFPLEEGGVLAEAQIAYETYGTLNEAGTNAILVCHALTGDAHAYGTPEHPGWWQGVIGPGSALDTERYFIICSNVLGGCFGSTGPHSLDPETGTPYGSRFPLVTIRDMVHAQRRLLGALGVAELHMVIGGSMGGLQAVEWAVTYPELVRGCISIGTSAQLSALAIAYNDVMRTAITADPNWQDGDYFDGEPPVRGLHLARKIGMITYRSFELFEQRYGRDTTDPQASLAETRFQMESYLDHMGDKLVRRFDPASYVCLLKAMDLHDIGRGRGGFEAAVERISCPIAWVGIDSDHLFPAVEQRQTAERLAQLGKRVAYRELHSLHGHDAFLLEIEQMNAILREFLQQAEQSSVESPL
ncbi:MAG: homoserine O-acetyltransferase MetX [Tumebacillaceae bacterium]